MSEKIKKIIVISLFVLVVVALAFLLYLMFFKKPVTPPEEVIPEEVEEERERVRLPVTKQMWEGMEIKDRLDQGLPALEWPEDDPEEIIEPVEKIVPQIDDVAQGGRTWVNPVLNEKVSFPTLAADGENNIYYDSDSGYFYSTDIFGNKELFSDQIFYNVEKINWSPVKDKAILEYPDGFKVMYDFEKNQQYTLPKIWQDFSWNRTGTKIAFQSISAYPENNWLAIASPDGSQSQPLEHVGENADKVTVSWSPNNQVVAFSATGDPRGTWEQEILLIGQNQENFKSLVIDGRGFEPQWSPQGDKIAYSVYSAQTGYLPRLYIVDAQGNQIGQNKKNTGLATWAHKCTFSQTGEELYCAVPRELPEGAGLVLELAENSRDDFYKIDVLTGTVSFLAEGAMGGYNVKDIYLSAEEDLLYFIDENTGRLRYINLK
jgi:hypothetical protein